MSSFETTAFVVEGGFGPESQKNPALVFAEEALKVFDSRDHSSFNEWVTDDYSSVPPSGVHNHQGSPEQNFKATKEIYDKLLTAYRHIPESMVVVNTKDGYKLIGRGTMCANLLAISSVNPAKASGPDGSKWDVVIPIFAEFEVVKDANAKHHGLLFKQTRFTIDQNQMLKGIESRGLSVPSFLKGGAI